MNQKPWTYNKAIKEQIPEQKLADYFRRILDKGDSVVVTTYGKPNSGKSLSMIELMRLITPEFEMKRDVSSTLPQFYESTAKENMRHKYVTKLLDDFGSQLDPTKPFDVIIRDFISYMQVFRTENAALFITTPHRKFLNKDVRERIATHYIEIIKKSKRYKCVKAKIQLIQTNLKMDQPYYHNLSYTKDGIVNDKAKGKKVRVWSLAPPPKEIIKEYEPLRLEIAARNRLKGLFSSRKKQVEDEDEVIAEDIEKNIDRYILITKKGKKKLNLPLIEIDKQIGGRRASKISALIKSRNMLFKD